MTQGAALPRGFNWTGGAVLLAGLLVLGACATVGERRGSAVCLVRGLSMPTPLFGDPSAGEGYAMEALAGAYDLDQARAACVESVYQRLAEVYAAAGNLEPATWEVVIYDRRGAPVASDLSRFGGGLVDEAEPPER